VPSPLSARLWAPPAAMAARSAARLETRAKANLRGVEIGMADSRRLCCRVHGSKSTARLTSGMSPDAFCTTIQEELAFATSDDSWVRGARGLCELYGRADAQRFEMILVQVAAGRPNSALADGARWLLPRWQVASRHT
jgi:hypothetical protein